MKLKFISLASGSSGNCIYVGSESTHLLVDVGISGKRTEAGLNELDLSMRDIDGIFITHEHTDHTKGVGILSRKYHVPVYANQRTFEAMAKTVGEIPKCDRRYFETGEDFYVNDLALLPFAISHDAAEPVGYRIFAGGASVAVATDMGYMQKNVLKTLAGTQVMVLESNYDPSLLMQNPHYTAFLKCHRRTDTCRLFESCHKITFTDMHHIRKLFYG